MSRIVSETDVDSSCNQAYVSKLAPDETRLFSAIPEEALSELGA